MHDFMKVFLSLSLSGALLTLLIFILKPLYQYRLSRQWQYYIWLAAALRFLIPIAPDTTLVGSLFQFTDPVISDKILVIEEPSAKMNPLFSGTLIILLWIIPALALFIRKIITYRGFLSFLKMENTRVSHTPTLNLLAACMKRKKIEGYVKLYYNPTITSPIMTGFYHPCIILPAGKTDPKELIHIFMHELTHYKRQDFFYKWFVQIVICLHWFNPFVYLLEKEVNKACELSCDEAIISSLDEKGKKAYGDTLLSFLKVKQTPKSSYASLRMIDGADQIKERLGAIMNFKKKGKTTILVTIISTIAVCICFILIGAYVVPSSSPEKTAVDENISSTTNLTKDGSDGKSDETVYVERSYEYSPVKISVVGDVVVKTSDQESEDTKYVETYEFDYDPINKCYIATKIE